MHYPADYFGYAIHDDEPLLLRPFLRAFARGISLRRIRYLEKVRGKIETDTAIVDVGCGANRLLQTIDEVRGCRGLGVDFKPEIVAYVRDELKLPIVEGTLQTAAFEDGRFDVVLMMEYLEHEPDPRAVLEEARRVTRTGGELALELPLMAWPGRLFGPNWWNLDIPRHLIFFSPETLSQMLDECGYELLSVKPFTLPLYVGMSILQVLGLRHWARYKALYPILSSILGLPFVPFQPLIPEFMFVVARAK